MDLYVWGSLRHVLQTLNDLQGDSSRSFRDSEIASRARMPVKNVRYCLEALCQNNFISLLGQTDGGYVASIEAEGRVALTTPWNMLLNTFSAIRIVPKGLRSFDAKDSSFFLDLLPLPRDERGLPESIRYWKNRIEEFDPEKTFRVGVIYGPCGCGKSSLVRAGLVPNLTDDILVIDVEAAPVETESLLMKGIRKNSPELNEDKRLAHTLSELGEGRGMRKGKRKALLIIDQFEQWLHAHRKWVRKKCPGLDEGKGLAHTLSELGEGRGMPEGKRKALLIIDQFEQWLHAHRSGEGGELIDSLKNCDGGRVQAIVMVRDEFWMGLTRFMAEIEVTIRQDLNCAAIDLFGTRHAKEVLKLFGQAYGALPDDTEKMTNDQWQFVDDAVSELAREEKEARIAPVRLALFAQMLSEKDWSPSTLQSVGGAEGVGVEFLKKTFDTENGRRRYQLSARDVKSCESILGALLPEIGSDIRGGLKSVSMLREKSGYADRPTDFDRLLQILDAETRLITPTEGAGSAAGGRYYLLTHDYLVPSIREWLTRKQKETHRGRAELLLADRSSLWNAKPENRHLASVLEWANIRLLTKKKDWTDPQRKMMRRAGCVHGLRTLALAALIALITWGGYEAYGSFQARALVDSLKTASTAEVPDIVKNLSGYYRWARRPLSDLLSSTEEQSSPHHLHASLALLPVDPGQVEYLYNRMLNANPTELTVIREALSGHQWTLIERLWGVLENTQADRDQRFRAAWALAGYVADETEQRWVAASRFITDRLLASVIENPSSYTPLMEMLRPIRKQLLTSLATTFRDPQRPKTERYFATNILADYASDQPNLLADLLMDADPKAYADFFPIAQRQESKTLPLFQDEIARTLAPTWNDPPLDLSWTKPDAILTAKIESAQGMFTERFGFCQTMPLDQFVKVAEALRPSGYRPTRFRLYAEGKSLRVAAVWTRDGRNWRMAHGQSAENVRQTDERNRKEGYLSVDVAGYLAVGGEEGKPTTRFAALWAQRTGPNDEAQMFVASSVAELTKVQEQLKNAGLVPLTLHAWRQADDKLSYSGVWYKTATRTSDTASFQGGLLEANLPGVAAQQSGSLIDIDLAAAPPPPSTKERALSALQAAEAALKAKPNDRNSRYDRGCAYIQLGENQKAIDDLNAVIEKAPQAVLAYRYRAIAHARLGHKDQARADLEKFQKSMPGESISLYLALIVAAELGEGTDQAVESLEAALKKQPQDSVLHWNAACAYSQASHAVARKDQAKSKSLSERALSLLRKAIENGYDDYKHMQEAVDLDPCRDLPAFADIMKAGHLDRSYAAVWTGHFRFEASPLFGLDPTAHLQRCRELVTQGYRMVTLSVTRTSPEAPPITASVWHRPVITEETKDQLAERQARAAVALVRMGKPEEVWPLLRHSADPRLRSFIVNWLNPLGADPKLIVAELDRIDPNAKPTPAQGQQFMDAILFHPETSMRRALILAIGTYGTEGLSPGVREPLTGKLLDLYRNDPDSGIHGAAEWTLRQWKQQEKLKELDAELMKLKDWGERRWYVNGQGQTYAVIEGPVEFRMGSPPTDTERFAGNEPPRRMAIPRRFAIAAKEVSVEQFQRFLKLGGITIDLYRLSASDRSRFSPDPQGPWIAPDWYTAAHYCNWLSEQEGLSEDQWCYLPNEAGAYAEGMSIPANVLERTGYRLPTEAEWEFTCRAGAVTSRYYGHSLDLLDAYARYQANSKEHAWTCGSLFPNDLGLFDMLGSMYEWCQDSWNASKPAKKGIYNDLINISESIVEKNPRLVRGGSFNGQPAYVRSAFRFRYAPATLNIYNGFRPSRTYP